MPLETIRKPLSVLFVIYEHVLYISEEMLQKC
jgi:hypothetical protein